MGDANFIASNKNLDFNTAVEAVIRRSCIIDFGIVQKVPANGIVNVAVAVADTEQNMLCLTCVLANIASSSFTVNVKPNVGDRVLVIYPRLYDETMFTVPDNESDKKKVIVKENASGYNMLSGIAILMNQYKTASHKNVITLDNGKVDLKFLYDKDNDKYKLTFATNEDGAINVDSNGNTISLDKDGAVDIELAYDKDNDVHKLTFATDENGACTVTNEKGTVTLGADGYINYKQTEQGNNTQLQFTKEGFTIKDKVGNSIVSSHGETEDTIVINGNLKVKK